jgi:hypothetical protein
MSMDVRLLLPILGAEDLDHFARLPLESLLASNNLPALAQRAKLVLVVLAKKNLIERFTQTVFRRFAGYCELQSMPLDDVVLDYPFEVVPSLAYQKAMANAPAETAFVFLQHNLVLADGALRAVGDRLQAGERILCATCLRAARNAFEKSLSAIAVDVRFAPRTIVAQSLEALDLRDVGSLVDSDVYLHGKCDRLIWKQAPNALLVYDFAPSLIALKPEIIPTEACGFREAAFARAMAPAAKTSRFLDSEQFCAVELFEPRGTDVELRFGSKDAASRAVELAACTSAAQRQSGSHVPAVFSGGKLPANLSETRKKAQRYIDELVEAAGTGDGWVPESRWKLSYYLWRVRAFELGFGSLPQAPFTDIFSRLKGAEASGASPAALPFSPTGTIGFLLRAIRDHVLGRVPFVTPLHPEWASYREVAPVLRDAMQKQRARTIYVADGIGVFARVLGPPDFTALELSESGDKALVARPSLSDLAIVELSSTEMGNWADLALVLLPSMSAGGRIVLYLRNVAGAPYETLLGVMSAGLGRLDARLVMRGSIKVANSTVYHRWLNQGFPLALSVAQSRRWDDLLKAGALVGVVSGLTFLSNVLGRRQGAERELWSSVTIDFPVNEAEASA